MVAAKVRLFVHTPAILWHEKMFFLFDSCVEMLRSTKKYLSLQHEQATEADGLFAHA